MQPNRLIEMYLRDYCSPIYPANFESLRYSIKNAEWNCLETNVFQSIEIPGEFCDDMVLGFWHCEDYCEKFEARLSQKDLSLGCIKRELQEVAKRGCRFLLLDYSIDLWESLREEICLEEGERILFDWGMHQIENFLNDRPILNVNGTALKCPNPLGFVERTIYDILEQKKE